MFIRCWCETCIFTHSITIVVLFILCASRVLTCYPATSYILYIIMHMQSLEFFRDYHEQRVLSFAH